MIQTFHAAVARLRVAGGGGGPTPILAWPMSNGSGGTITATVGPNGTTNCSWQTGASGSGNSLGFNGTDQSAISGSSVAYGSPVITVMAWVYATDWNAATENSVWESVPSYAAGAPSFVLGFQSGTINAILGQSGGYRIENFTQGGESLSNGTWYHFAVVYDNDANAGAGDIKVYKNGSLITTADGGNTKAGTGDINTAAITLGARNQASAWFGGRIDDFRIYGEELDASAIAAIYAEGSD